MTDDALTLAVLREIRDELRSTRTELGGEMAHMRSELRQEIRETNVRLDEANSRLGHLESAMVDFAQQQTFVVRWLKAGAKRDRRLERDLVKLTERVDAIEARLPADD